MYYSVVDLRSLSIPDLKEPFNLQRGWLLWAGIGLVGAVAAIALTGVAMSTFNGEPPQREVRIELTVHPIFWNENFILCITFEAN